MEASPSLDAACDAFYCGPTKTPDTRTIFIVDWDGTVTEDAWPAQGAWIDGAVEALDHLLTMGRVKIFSSRLNPYQYGHDGELLRDPQSVEADIQAIRAVLDSVGLQEVEIHTTPGKPTGHYYIDNRAIEFGGSWDQVLGKIDLAERKFTCGLDAIGDFWMGVARAFEPTPNADGIKEFVTTNLGGSWEEAIDGEAMRTFDTGATRNKDTNKADYEGFLSPLVIRAFGEYMHAHRYQADGTLRDSDNWQKGIPLPAYMKSGWRHLADWWCLHRGIPVENPDTGNQVDLKEALCGVIFNASGYLHEILSAEDE